MQKLGQFPIGISDPMIVLEILEKLEIAAEPDLGGPPLSPPPSPPPSPVLLL